MKILAFFFLLACYIQAHILDLDINGDDVSWNGTSGVTYEIWYSTNLIGWTNSNITKTGIGTQAFKVSDIFTTSLPEKAFFQIRWDGFVDSDKDEMDDAWEQALVDSNTSDGIIDIVQLLPSDDFDNDGIKNYDEYRYELDSTVDDPNLSTRKIVYNYEFNRIETVTVTGGSSVTFAYDANQNLTSAN